MSALGSGPSSLGAFLAEASAWSIKLRPNTTKQSCPKKARHCGHASKISGCRDCVLVRVLFKLACGLVVHVCLDAFAPRLY